MVQGHPCPCCGKEREYKSQQGADRSKGRLCRSCSNSVSNGGSGIKYDEEGRRLCAHCKSSPSRHNNSLCQPCSTIDHSARYASNYRYSKYGVTKEWFDSRFKGRCEVCEDTLDRSEAHIDHCHDSGKVRGILCGLCNKGLGQFKDNIERLKAAIRYLEG